MAAYPTSTDVVTTTTELPKRHRISWGAILAGVVITWAVNLLLQSLGISIGAALINPLETLNFGASQVATPATDVAEQVQGFGTGAVIWIAASTLLALFAGGYVTGRLADTRSHTDGALHGLAVWGLVAVITFFGLAGITGSVIGTAANLFGQAVSGLGAVATSVVPEGLPATFGIGENELNRLYQDSGVANVAQDPEVRNELRTIALTLIQQGPDGITDETRQSAINAYAAAADVPEAEAAAQIEQLETNYRNAVTTAQEQAAVVAQRATDALAATAGIVFLSLLIGAFAAGAGGFAGVPDIEDEEAVVVQRTQQVR